MIRIAQEYGTVLDAIGISLCLAIMGYLIYSRVKYGRKVRRQQLSQDFGDQVVQSMISQQIRRVLTAVMENVDQELNLLAASLPADATAGSGNVRSIGLPPAAAGAAGGFAHYRMSSEDRPQHSVPAGAGLIKSQSGLAAGAQPRRLSMAEVELSDWIDQHRNKDRDKADTAIRQ